MRSISVAALRSFAKEAKVILAPGQPMLFGSNKPAALPRRPGAPAPTSGPPKPALGPAQGYGPGTSIGAQVAPQPIAPVSGPLNFSGSGTGPSTTAPTPNGSLFGGPPPMPRRGTPPMAFKGASAFEELMKMAFNDELSKIAGVNAPLSLRQVPGALKKLDGNVTKELWKPGGGNIARVEQNQLSIGATKHPLYPKGTGWGVGKGKLDHYNETGSPIVEHAANQLHEESKFFNPQARATSRVGSPPPPASPPLQVVKDPFPAR